MEHLAQILVPIVTALGAGLAAFFTGRRVERKRNNTVHNPGPPTNCPFANEAIETKMDNALRELEAIRQRTGETLSAVKIIKDRLVR